MPKLNICAARRPGMTHTAYSRYLRDDHARLVLGTEPVSRYLQSYVQQHVYDASYGAACPAWRYDSVSHIHAATVADQMAATATPEYNNVIAPDEARFADGRSALFLMFEEVPLAVAVKGPSSHRLLHYVQLRPGASADELHAAWAQAHDAARAEAPALLNGVRRAVLNKTVTAPGGPAAPYAGMFELGFVQRSDESAVIDHVLRLEERIEGLIQRDASFYLLAEAVPVRGTLD